MTYFFGCSPSAHQQEAGEAPLATREEEEIKNDNIDDDFFKVGYCYLPSHQLTNLCFKLESNDVDAIDTAGLQMDVNCCKLLAVALWNNKSLQSVFY